MDLSSAEKKEINDLIDRLTDDQCVEMIQEFSDQEMKVVKSLIELGIDPLSDDSPYTPYFTGRIYLEEGIRGVEEKMRLNIDQVRSVLNVVLQAEASLEKLYKEAGKGKHKIIVNKVSYPSIKRMAFKLINCDD